MIRSLANRVGPIPRGSILLGWLPIFWCFSVSTDFGQNLQCCCCVVLLCWCVVLLLLVTQTRGFTRQPESPTFTFKGPRLQNSTRRPHKEERMRFSAGERKKKERNFGRTRGRAVWRRGVRGNTHNTQHTQHTQHTPTSTNQHQPAPPSTNQAPTKAQQQQHLQIWAKLKH